MKTRFVFATGLAVTGVFFAGLTTLFAGTRYVDANNPTPISPYTNWATAANVIQQAIDVAGTGEEVLVTNGVYRTGGRQIYDVMTRAVVTQAVTVRSVNGPAVTLIEGNPVIGDEAVRCAYLGSGGVLSGFTLTNGATRDFIWWPGSNYGRVWGGGVWCESSDATVSNCVLTANFSKYYGGGAHGGVLIDCALSANSGWYGGGASSNTLIRCTLTGNAAYTGGGASGCVLSNCVVTANASTAGAGADASALYHCAVLENVAESSGGGASGSSLVHCTLTGNRAASEGGGASACFLTNCIAYYNEAPAGMNAYGSSLENCCTLPLPQRGTGNFSDAPRLVDGYHLAADSLCRGRGNTLYAAGFDIDGEAWLSPPAVGADEYHSGSTSGPLTVSIRAGRTNFAAEFPAAFSVGITGRPSASVWNFGDGTVVSNSPYVSHAWTAPGIYTVTATAYNDTYPAGVSAAAQVQVAPGQCYVSLLNTAPRAPFTSWDTAATNIQDALNAAPLGATVWVTNGVYDVGGRVVGTGITNRVAVEKPVTLRSVNGPAATVIAGYQVPDTVYGTNAVRCVYLTNGAVLSGFTLVNGSTDDWGPEPPPIRGNGGGILCESTSALVTNCIITNNWGGFGGGAAGGTFRHCRLTANRGVIGGGVNGAVLENCLLDGNSAIGYGGGAAESTLNNCTVVSNLVTSPPDVGGGVFSSTSMNCIVYDNQPENWYYNCSLNYSCTTPLPEAGAGNLTNAPLFVDALAGNFRLQAGSPCVNVGSTAEAPAGPDLDNASRIVDGAVDMGAYEFPLASPIRFLSAGCRFLPAGEFQLSFNGATNGAYDVWFSENLTEWLPLGSASTLSPGQFGFSDAAATNSACRFYRATPRHQ